MIFYLRLSIVLMFSIAECRLSGVVMHLSAVLYIMNSLCPAPVICNHTGNSKIGPFCLPYLT